MATNYTETENLSDKTTGIKCSHSKHGVNFLSCKWDERVLINTLMNDDDPIDSTPTCKLEVEIFSLIRYTSAQLPNGAL